VSTAGSPIWIPKPVKVVTQNTIDHTVAAREDKAVILIAVTHLACATVVDPRCCAREPVPMAEPVEVVAEHAINDTGAP
jgi:hypothetical protein